MVSRRFRKGVTERLLYDGSVSVPLDVGEATKVVKELARSGVESIAICTLFSYLNDAHEKKIAKAFRDIAPGIHLSISSELVPEYREYERLSTTVINAVLLPLVDRYLTGSKGA